MADPQLQQSGPFLVSRWIASINSRLGLKKGELSKIVTTLLLAAVAGILHWQHISRLFENDRHFSHLSTLEREMTFRTEMGLYYSYFKIIIEAPSFSHGLSMIMNDRLTEYPLAINTLKRFNLYPEVVLAGWYRMYTGTMEFFGSQTKMCWTVHRGQGLEPVKSCEGLGDPAYFYVTFVFILNGIMMSVFFIYGTFLSGSRLGGVVTVSCFFFNHGECTRVMWTPPLRESFSYPFLIVQMLLVTFILRSSRTGKSTLAALCVANVLFMLPWQFAQFVLLTQIASLFTAYVVGYVGSDKLENILYAHMISLLVCFVLMFGNAMLLTSFYASSLLTIWGVLTYRQKLLAFCKNEIVAWVVQGFAWFIGTIILKVFSSKVLGIADDAHISNLLKSKFTSYKDFDTLMYTCAAEFDFMEKETSKTLWKFLKKKKPEGPGPDLSGDGRQKEHFAQGEVVYNALQLIAFAVLALLIMRLKLFLTPHMCIMASLVCSKQLYRWLSAKFRRQIIIFSILAVMAIHGSTNLQTQWSIIGEFSNLPQEELLEWIKANTKQDAVFAGSMPAMASVKLSTSRPIVNHPHYEDAHLRARTKQVYSMYSRKPAKEVKNALLKLGVDYFILEDSWCRRWSRPGCSMPEIWDVEDPKNAGKTPLCILMAKDPRPHFITVFENDVYKVLKIKRKRAKTMDFLRSTLSTD
nr:PREDICTED: probable C-mannosyltransferase DPY19L1 isoform X2 [Latimeria chalumnae]|eukprot:XP_014349718.1 PREDICTED: probable C-mannosyltransferase DPY19L1 isoform X2 [Latimeria chalumnae]